VLLLLLLPLQSDLALLTVSEAAFWTDLRPLEFIKETPELQVGCMCAKMPTSNLHPSIDTVCTAAAAAPAPAAICYASVTRGLVCVRNIASCGSVCEP
jgi:hypothetical protein